MSKLSKLLREREATPAISAIPAIPPSENSGNSKNSRGADSRSHAEARLITCAACLHYRERPGEAPDGFCRHFDVETWGRVEFSCPGYEPADEPVRAREARQVRVEAELRAHPDQRLCFEVADAPLKGSPGEPVSVVLAVRHGSQILSGEVRIPRERWDLQAFLTTVEPSPGSGVPS